ncbi:MAG: hypothetical protein V9F00_04835 [Nocardioides sp.]
MDELHLTAGDDHVKRVAHENDPVRAIVELIWNAIDAEADHVTVVLEHDDVLGGIIDDHCHRRRSWDQSRRVGLHVRANRWLLEALRLQDEERQAWPPW